jgi:hypothetical protein
MWIAHSLKHTTVQELHEHIGYHVVSCITEVVLPAYSLSVTYCLIDRSRRLGRGSWQVRQMWRNRVHSKESLISA